MTESGEPLFKIGPFEGRTARDGSYYYVEVGGNKEVLNGSQLYKTVEHAEEGARSALAAAREGGEQ